MELKEYLPVFLKVPRYLKSEEEGIRKKKKKSLDFLALRKQTHFCVDWYLLSDPFPFFITRKVACVT